VPGFIPDERLFQAEAMRAEAMRAASTLSGVSVEQGKAFLAAFRTCLEECRRRHLRQSSVRTGGSRTKESTTWKSLT
jgi:hypothetical protein